MAVANKVRVYDLARELKQDTKRIIEDLRREGADVDVPSNSVPKELADKVRNKYFPKKETAPVRAIKVIKKAKYVEEETPAAEEPVIETPEEAPEEETPVVVEAQPVPEVEEAVPAKADKQVRKLKKPVVTETAEEEPVEIIEETAEPAIADAAEAEEVAAPVKAPEVKVVKQGTQVKQIRISADALKTIKASEEAKVAARVPKTVEAAAGDRTARKKGFREEGLRGTPGETSTPQLNYVPSPDSRRPKGRSTGKARGGDRRGGRDARFNDQEVSAPRPKTIEERIIDQVNVAAGENDSKHVRLADGATVRDFAEKLGIVPRDIVQLLLKKGVFATLNQPINERLAVDLGESFGYEISFVPFEEIVVEEEFEELIAADADDVELQRAPVVTVMGHVDHGKTSLLDAIRQENVAEGEAGGITQHIGAYSVQVHSADSPDEKRRVVFLDTPGHEAFTMMRARGAKATDVVVLVVAADDGVMPQTIEAIDHAKAANVPIIVAINKIDKPGANADKVKQELAQQGLQPIDWGGDVEMVPVSAKKKENLSTLLETILLTADILDLKASPTRRASGVVLEAKLDKGRGAVATVLVQQGTLSVGDPFIVGQISGKVRAMFNDRGEEVKEASPATPVEVLGLQGVPHAGDNFQVVADVSRATEIAQQRQMKARQSALAKSTRRGIESLGLAEVKELLIILKADVQGSVEVLKSTLEKLSTDKVKVRVIRAGVGAIAESDVLLASATQADNTQTAVVIIGFNVRPETRTAEVAKQEQVDIRLHSVIYKIEEEIRAAMIGMLDAIEKEAIIGKAEVSEVFKVPKLGAVAGSRVIDGIMKRHAKARLIRDSVVVWEGELESLRRFKDDVTEVRQGFECGIGLHNFNDIKVGDQIEAYVIEKIAATSLE
ncbi:MAG TPA: translation initiation factor IF-2 [Pyrinomonadaceae bacterium]|jgi:translation initiation factor IF-2|nr:translation initiation factor IF-2 [Pyrinomonadaceae bacterium]